jgi:aldehyde dehydrogenase (NAD+)
MLKIVPALLVGCTCVLKPSELSPLSALRLAQAFHDAGFPPGVVNVVNGDGVRTGSFLSNHPDIDMISFTGSTHVGRTLQQIAAQHPKSPRLALEMGGKGAHIIFSDVTVNSMFINTKQKGIDGEDEDEDEDEDDEPDTLDDILFDSVWEVMINSGQSCNAPTRLLVQAPLYKYAVDKVKAIVDSISINSAHVTGPHLGPVVSRQQFEKIQDYMRSAIDEGAKLKAGGPEWPSDKNKPTPGGFFVQPTLFVDCAGTMKIMQEEVFGPVICMASFDNEEEAIRLANDSPYGLQHYVSTRDEDRLVRLAQRLDAGMITLNGEDRAALSFFGGTKSSGNAREGGVYGLDEFTVTKAVSGLSASLVQKLSLNIGMEKREEEDGNSEQDQETDEDDEEESQRNLFMNEL